MVFDRTTEAGGPGKAALDDPACWPQHQAALGLGQLDDLQLDAMFACNSGRLVAVISLIDTGQLHARSGGRLNRLGYPRELGPLAAFG